MTTDIETEIRNRQIYRFDNGWRCDRYPEITFKTPHAIIMMEYIMEWYNWGAEASSVAMTQCFGGMPTRLAERREIDSLLLRIQMTDDPLSPKRPCITPLTSSEPSTKPIS